MIPVYSPSSTELWKQCPLKHHLQRVENLEPRSSRSLLPRLAGSAIAEGLKGIHGYWRDNGTDTIPTQQVLREAKEIGGRYMNQAAEHYAKHGASFDATVLPGKTVEVQRAIELYTSKRPLGGYKIREVEYTLPQHGNARLDLVAETAGGETAVIEIKYKQNLEEKYRQRTVNRYLKSWQFQHYAWAYSDYTKQHVDLTILLLITARPAFSAMLYPYRIHKEWQTIWLQSAKQSWQDMYDERQGKRDLVAAAVHEDSYGQCEMQGVCFDHLLDIEAATKGDYVIVPKFVFDG